MLVSSMEMQVLWRKLRHKNAIRRQLGIRQFHVPTVFKRKLRLTEEHRYNELLEPYLIEAFADVDWPDGLGGRLLIAVRLHKRCVDQLHIDHGIADPRERNPDMVAVINRLVPDADQTVSTVSKYNSCPSDRYSAHNASTASSIKLP
jgi:hypothetical protein